MSVQERPTDLAVLGVYESSASDACDIARKVILEAGAFRGGRAHRKGCLDFWTDTDVKVEGLVMDLLADRWPEHTIVGEELPPHRGGDFTWFIDPLDGTNNFIAGRPEVAFSIALYLAEDPIVAAIDLPHRRLRFIGTAASAPRMLTDDDERIVDDMPSAGPIQLVGLPGDLRRRDERTRVVRAVSMLSREFGLRVTGALAYDLATMLSGELVARVSYSPKPVDVAAAALLLPAAGAVITAADGTRHSLDSKSILASATPDLHRQLVAALTMEGEPGAQ